mgnify:CR=1 FL=1
MLAPFYVYIFCICKTFEKFLPLDSLFFRDPHGVNRTPSPTGTPSIIMVFASKLIENRFVKFISFDDGEHSCYNFGS